MAKALKRRGSLTIWFDPGMARAALPTGQRGRQPVYADAAVQCCLTIKVLFERKVHPGIDKQTLEIRAVEVTSSDVGDAPHAA